MMLRTVVITRPFSLIDSVYVQTRSFAERKGILKNFIDKIQEEYKRDKELKDSLKKFREGTEKLEKSEEILKMRSYYRKIEKDIAPDAQLRVKEAMKVAKSKLDDIKNQELVQKSFENVSKAAQQVGEKVSSATQQLGESDVMKAAKEGIKVLDKELETDRGKMYAPPKILKTRAELAGKEEEKIISPDDDTTGVVLHKDSKWYAAWQDFRDNNTYMQKFFDLKMKYDESENPMVRSARFMTERIRSVFGNMGGGNELQITLAEIHKMDPSFSVESFLKYCRFHLVPNVLEAIVRGDLPVLKDWCYEAPYNLLSQPFTQAEKLGLFHECRVLDVRDIDLATGKMMEQGPVLVINFTAQQLQAIRDKNNKVVEGDPEKIFRVTHVWALCRDQNELNPWAAWRVLDIAMMPTEQWM